MSSSHFHRDPLFNDPRAAWDTYRHNPDYFVFPERITIELTNRCNLQCTMCPRHTVSMALGDMDVSLFHKIIDEITHFLPVCVVPFFRGESLLHPHVLDMLSYARNKNIRPLQLATNAFFLDHAMAKGLLDLTIDFLSFSIDCNDEAQYVKIRKNSDFKRVFSHVTYFLEEKQRRNITLPIVQISTVETQENTKHIAAFIDFWKDKVDRVRVYPAHSWEGKLGHVSEQKKPLNRQPCLKLLTDMVIYWNGEVGICNHDWERDVYIGNVNEQTIQQIWTNATYLHMRQRHGDGHVDGIVPCNECSHWQSYYTEKKILGEVYE